MKVLVIAHSFPRFPGDTHGPFVERLAQETAARGHDVHVLVPWDRELVTAGREPLTVHSFRYTWPPRAHLLGYSRTLARDRGLKVAALLQSPGYFACGARAVGRLLQQERFDLVHAHWILPNGWLAWRACRRRGVPYCVTLHGSDVFMAERNPLFGSLARRALAGASHVTSCSADLRDRLLGLAPGVPADRVRLVPNGTDLPPRPTAEARREARARWGLPADAPLAVAVGRLVDKKGFRYLIEALPALLERMPDARLALGGGGPLAGELAAAAERLGVADRVVFTGPLSHPDVLALVAAGDVFVMPSVRDPSGNVDGLPVVVLEAMAAGLPVVASDLAGIPLAVADGVHGRLVPEQDSAALARAVGELLADPERAAAAGRAARERVARELHWGAIAAVHDELYERAVAQGSGADGRP